MAGLSHALVASGFHLFVLLGSVLMLARLLPSCLRLPLAAMALLLFVCLAGALPSVVRSIGDPGGALTLVAVSKPSGLVETAGSAAMKPSEGFHRHMAGLQIFQLAALIDSGA